MTDIDATAPLRTLTTNWPVASKPKRRASWGQPTALELLAKLRGDLIDRSEVKTLGGQIVLNGVNVEDLK